MTRGRAGNGRSSIYRDEGGVWHGWVTMGRDTDGKTIRRHLRGKTATEVSDRVAEFESQRAGTAGRAVTSARATLGDWIDEWLRIILVTRKPRTCETYETLMRVHCLTLRRVPVSKTLVRLRGWSR